MEPLFALYLCGELSSRDDCSPLGRILVPLVGYISLEIPYEWQLERCGGGNVCLAGDLSARLSLRRLLTYLERRVTTDSYTKVISL
jgi:hypothetical protein